MNVQSASLFIAAILLNLTGCDSSTESPQSTQAPSAIDKLSTTDEPSATESPSTSDELSAVIVSLATEATSTADQSSNAENEAIAATEALGGQIYGRDILNLRDTQISDSGLEHLKGLTDLSDLDLSGTQITETQREVLKAALPRCDVYTVKSVQGVRLTHFRMRIKEVSAMERPGRTDRNQPGTGRPE